MVGLLIEIQGKGRVQVLLPPSRGCRRRRRATRRGSDGWRVTGYAPIRSKRSKPRWTPVTDSSHGPQSRTPVTDIILRTDTQQGEQAPTDPYHLLAGATLPFTVNTKGGDPSVKIERESSSPDGPISSDSPRSDGCRVEETGSGSLLLALR